MNRNEAYETMIRGDKIKNVKWINGAYAFYRDGRFIFFEDEKEYEVGTCMDWGNNYEIYQEPKPVRKLVAFEALHETGGGEFMLGYTDTSFYDQCTNQFKDNYRKLSDQELKELINGVIGE